MPVVVALCVAVPLVAAGWARLRRREHRLRGEVNDLAERMRELSARVEAAEADVAHAVTQAEIAEAVSRCANITVPDAKDRAQVIGQALLTGVAVQLGGPKENLQ